MKPVPEVVGKAAGDVGGLRDQKPLLVSSRQKTAVSGRAPCPVQRCVLLVRRCSRYGAHRSWGNHLWTWGRKEFLGAACFFLVKFRGPRPYASEGHGSFPLACPSNPSLRRLAWASRSFPELRCGFPLPSSLAHWGSFTAVGVSGTVPGSGAHSMSPPWCCHGGWGNHRLCQGFRPGFVGVGQVH